MFLVNILQVLLFALLVLVKGLSVLLPNNCLLLVYLLLLNLLLFFLIDLTSKVVSHLFLLLFSNSLSPLILFLFLSQLILYVPHHFLILGPDLFLLVLDD